MTGDIWTIKAALDWTVGYLERKGDETPLVSAQWLLSEATGLSRIDLYVNHDKPLSMEEREVLRGYVTRRGKGEPLQYITGEVGFRHIMVKVRQGVLIPRPETEVLVSEVLAALPAAERPRSVEFLAELAGDTRGRRVGNTLGESGADLADSVEGEDRDESAGGGFAASCRPDPLLVADICTGSGCIACSIAYEHPGTRVIATDIAPEALSLARVNVELLGLKDRVEVHAGDLGAAVPQEFMGRFDAIVSNPPYVPTSVMDEIPSEVANFEPALALDGGEDGLDIYRRLLPWMSEALKSGGFFACELHETCLDEAAELARGAGYANVRIVYDLTGRPRVLTGVKA